MNDDIGIRALKQNASAVVAEAAAGKVVTITVRGRAAARLMPIPTSPLAGMLEAGTARPARTRPRDLAAPEPGPALSETLAEMRESERY